MEHVRLGRTGLKVSRLCLGTMTFGLQCDEETSQAILDRASEGGVTFIDTADVYPLGGGLATTGRTEEIVGRWLEGRRHDYVVATKCRGRTGRHAWDEGNSRKHIVAAVDESLRRLRTDYIDLYQLHRDDDETPLEETLRALDDLVRVGKVRYVGVSNFRAYRLATALGLSAAKNLVRFDCLQPRYNLLVREPENELLRLCADEGLGVIPYNPLAGGLLTGKHERGEPPQGTRFTLGNAAANYQERYWHDREFDTVDAIRACAEQAGIPMAQLAVAWTLSHPAVTSPILGASRPEQLDDTLRAAESPLDPDLKRTLDDLTEGFRGRQQVISGVGRRRQALRGRAAQVRDRRGEHRAIPLGPAGPRNQGLLKLRLSLLDGQPVQATKPGSATIETAVPSSLNSPSTGPVKP